MSRKYNEYLRQHIGNVNRANDWIKTNIAVKDLYDILPDLKDLGRFGFMSHDYSKRTADEYDAYDAYFNGPDGVKNENGPNDKVKSDFNYAWLHHIHNNPHHWQHWVLLNDDLEEGLVALEMPDRYILEMICDWWAFSWAKGDLYELFNWWNDHSDYILFGDETRAKVIGVLNLILDKVNELGGEVPALEQ